VNKYQLINVYFFEPLFYKGLGVLVFYFKTLFWVMISHKSMNKARVGS